MPSQAVKRGPQGGSCFPFRCVWKADAFRCVWKADEFRCVWKADECVQDPWHSVNAEVVDDIFCGAHVLIAECPKHILETREKLNLVGRDPGYGGRCRSEKCACDVFA